MLPARALSQGNRIRDGVVYPLEFKKTASPGKDAVKHFRVLEKLGMPIGLGGVICLSDRYPEASRCAQRVVSGNR
ncbi:MAG: hypothetical protein KJO08_03395 [Gammaproteobacteria bacterium]|nr:hypothetical protein [Gammaproteobacteria bacterium]NNJ85180.1 hypothetical protein [Gammaproteobacteria bacterium]